MTKDDIFVGYLGKNKKPAIWIRQAGKNRKLALFTDEEAMNDFCDITGISRHLRPRWMFDMKHDMYECPFCFYKVSEPLLTCPGCHRNMEVY